MYFFNGWGNCMQVGPDNWVSFQQTGWSYPESAYDYTYNDDRFDPYIYDDPSTYPEDPRYSYESYGTDPYDQYYTDEPYYNYDDQYSPYNSDPYYNQYRAGQYFVKPQWGEQCWDWSTFRAYGDPSCYD